MLKFRQIYIRNFLIFTVCFCAYKVSSTAINQPDPIAMIDKSIDASPDNILVKLILARHYTFTEQYEKSNKILLRERNSEYKNGIDEDIKENYKFIQNRPNEKSQL